MTADRGETRRRLGPKGPLKLERPPMRPWSSPTSGLPMPKKEDSDRTLKQILVKLVKVEKRLTRSKILSENPFLSV